MSIGKLTIAKSDLETALNQTGFSLGKDAQWTSHYFFRSNAKGVDVHTTNHRHCSSIPITTCSVHTDENAGAFTLDSSRIKKLLQHIDTSNALVFKGDSNKVVAHTAQGDLHFPITKNEFPYWDDALGDAAVWRLLLHRLHVDGPPFSFVLHEGQAGSPWAAVHALCCWHHRYALWRRRLGAAAKGEDEVISSH